ncbi:ribonuclease T2 [Zopfochytrium polystomum]|nr:ribonuclease T2 [Zopfochytrium polystomum]
MSSSPLLLRRATCSATTVACGSSSASSCCVPTNGELVLALQWLPGYCQSTSCSSGVLAGAPSNAWTLHGLWPDSCSGSQVSTCDSSRQYTDTQSRIQSSSIYSDMLTYWISSSGDYNTFWNHEWGKHGTCYSPADTSCTGTSKGADLVQFFSDALALRAKFDLYAPLAAAGITPGGSYSATKIRSAITAAYPGIAVGLQCTSGVLTEARLSLLGVGGGAVAKAASFSESDTCSGTVSYPKNSASTKTAATTTATKTTSTTKGTATSTPTSLGSCSYKGDTYCIGADGTSGSYKYCDGSKYIAATCQDGGAGSQYLTTDQGPLCYQDQQYYAGCY